MNSLKRLLPEFGVGVGNFAGVAVFDDFTVFDKDGTIAELADVLHGMGDKYNSLIVVFKFFEIGFTFFLECSITDGENLV